MSGDPNLIPLIGKPYAAEALGALADGPCTVAGLQACVRAPRRLLADSLRYCAAMGMVTTDASGSWDSRIRRDSVLQLTARGRRAIDLLSSFAVWTSASE